jgi:hypothetical protein
MKGDQFFQTTIFFGALVRTNWCTTICITRPILRKIARFLREIECFKFVYCKECVLVLVQIDLIQFENSNYIRSICTKTSTNSIDTNSKHTILRKIGQVILGAVLIKK